MATIAATVTLERDQKKIRRDRDRYNRYRIVADSGEQILGEIWLNKDIVVASTTTLILTYSAT